MASTFSHIFFSLFLVTFSSSSYAYKNINKEDLHSPLISNPKRPAAAEKLIRALNLFPEKGVNIVSNVNESPVSAPGIVEKRFQFPFLANSGASVKELGHHAGYFRLPHTIGARMFYFFFESRKSKDDPVVIWMNGGPGCSSDVALFYENGPFQITNNLTLVWNDYGWDQVSNIIYVDQPIGTGFSYSTDERDIRHDEAGVSTDLYDFLQAFFTKHPEYVENDFFLTGESYAGHYIPALASKIHKENKAKEGIYINLKGFAIGNGLTNPKIQYKAYADYALDMKLITNADKENVDKMYPPCKELIESCETKGGEVCEDAYASCSAISSTIMGVLPGVNYYDIRKKCLDPVCYDFSYMEKLLNEKSVREALGVGNIEFVSCSTVVYDAMIRDWVHNLEVGIPELLEDGIRMLIYAGEYDLLCNWIGNSNWVHAMEWTGQKAFAASPDTPFMVDNAQAGLLKSHGPLAFLKVHDAGHMVPMDQPNVSLQMLTVWMQGKLGLTGHDSIAPKGWL